MAARATVRNKGSRSATAARVAGNDPLKISTPRKPLIYPLAVLSIAHPCAVVSAAGHGNSRDSPLRFAQTVMERGTVRMNGEAEVEARLGEVREVDEAADPGEHHNGDPQPAHVRQATEWVMVAA